MIRLLSLSMGALLLAGCGKNDSQGRNDCEFQKLDLSACDRSGLGSVQTEGIWNMDLAFEDGERSSGVIKYLGEPKISGLPITSVSVAPNEFHLASDLRATDGRQYLFAGCRSASPTQVEGVFRRCDNGVQALSGTFTAARIQRRTGESDGLERDGLGIDRVSELRLDEGAAQDVFVAGGYAYVTAFGAGTYIYDVSNPADPSKVAHLKPPQGEVWHQVLVKGQTMYIASSQKGVLVYDVANPREPVALKSFPTGNAVDVRAVSVDGNWLYAAAPYPNAEVLIFDATNPRELVVAKRYFVEQTQPSRGDRPYDVLARDGRLYVSHWTYGLAVSDVTNPKQPSRLGSYPYANATTRTVDVGTIGNRTLAFEAGEAWGAHLRVLDVSAPALISQVAEFQLRPEVSISKLKLSGTKLYVAYYQDGLRVLDVSNPNEPRQVGYFNAWRETDPGRGASFFEGISDVDVPGDGYIYTVDTSRGLVILRETL